MTNYTNYKLCHHIPIEMDELFGHVAINYSGPMVITLDQRYLYVGRNYAIEKIELSSGQLVDEIFIPDRIVGDEGVPIHIEDLKLSYDGRLLATAHKSQTVGLWDSGNGTFLKYLGRPSHSDKDYTEDDYEAVMFTQDDEYVAAMGTHGRCETWTVNTQAINPNDVAQETVRSCPVDYRARKVTSNVDGSVLITHRALAYEVDLHFPLAGMDKLGKPLRHWFPVSVFSNKDHIHCSTISPNGQWFAVGSKYLKGYEQMPPIWDGSQKVGLIRLGHIPTQILQDSFVAHPGLLPFNYHTPHVKCLAFTPDSRTLISGGEDGWVRFWSVPSGELCHSLPYYKLPIENIVLSQDGKTLVVGFGGLVMRDGKTEEIGGIDIWELD